MSLPTSGSDVFGHRLAAPSQGRDTGSNPVCATLPLQYLLQRLADATIYSIVKVQIQEGPVHYPGGAGLFVLPIDGAGHVIPCCPRYHVRAIIRANRFEPVPLGRLDGQCVQFALGVVKDRLVSYTESLGYLSSCHVRHCCLHMFLISALARNLET
jgi:hypothetical protein